MLRVLLCQGALSKLLKYIIGEEKLETSEMLGKDCRCGTETFRLRNFKEETDVNNKDAKAAASSHHLKECAKFEMMAFYCCPEVFLNGKTIKKQKFYVLDMSNLKYLAGHRE
ncbi:conserved hypothetical protein [Ricinus communis]|uniref:Uncharacterized protein n=1 Tax=Ricinus communis TaxID=3988 RepID=B9SUL4_RICCO|nr:conserved hypothetical protein [Ricinus communis]